MAVVVVWSVEPLSFVVLFGLSPTCAAGLVRLGQWIPSEFSSQGVSTGESSVFLSAILVVSGPQNPLLPFLWSEREFLKEL